MKPGSLFVRLRDAWFNRWSVRQIICSLADHHGEMRYRPTQGNFVWICPHCGGAGLRSGL